MIVSVHIADVGRRASLGLLRQRPDASEVPGARYAQLTLAAPLGGSLLPRPQLGRVGLIAAWRDDEALDDFLARHPLAARLASGWHTRMRPTRVSGAWSALPDLPGEEEPMDDHEPAAVLTLGRLRLTQAVRFLRASAQAEGLAIREPALLASTGLAGPPRLVATFSLWRTTAAMRAYAHGHTARGHLQAIQAHAAKPFHQESAFVRFRPYAAHGSWDGREPLAGVLSATV